MAFLRIFPKRFLGIDIGTSAIKMVELSSWAGRIKLENYGEIPAQALYQKPFRTFEKSTLLLSSEDISKGIKAVFEEAKIKSKKCILSIPDFSTFFTTIELPQMTPEEIPQAVESEARRHIPLPLSEVTLDWQLIEGRSPYQKESKLKILLVTVPNEVISQYRQLASILKLELMSLEAEVFGLARALIEQDEKRVVGLVDIGQRSTTCSIIDKRILKVSHSFDISGDALTERIAKALGIDYEAAKDFKRKYGLLEKQEIREILIPLIDVILSEIDKTFKNFYWREKKEVEKIILAGGTALLPGLLEYVRDGFKKEAEVANPFQKIFYPPILDKTLREMGPSYAIAVGTALRGLE